ncbi:hypothetical protein ACWGB8_25085, partial [Kitasatospora sp. NPDC054939]
PQTPPPGRPAGEHEPRGRRPAPPRGRPGERQHTPAPGGRPTASRRRLLRQRVIVFVTVTLGVALAIAAAQGCENRDEQGLGRVGSTVAAGTPGSPAAGLSVDGVPPSPGPSATAPAGVPLAAARTGTPTGDGGLVAAAANAVPAVDWPNRTYPDPAGGPAVALRDGRSAAGAGPQVGLSAVLPARYREAPAVLVVLRRSEGSVPVDLVQLFGFTGDAPVPLASRSSAADPQAAATWRIESGSLVREERVAQTGAVASTRYTVRADGTLEESWPGAGSSGGTGLAAQPPAAAPAPPTSAH